ncbi:MAG: hypothetical protein JXB88_02065 [Spirochaetales bacterium]|nr:hypothetical protein [Spirochaetales bacterium]
MKKIICLYLLLLLLSLFSCSIGGPAGKYLSHVNKIFSILLKNPDDAVSAADEVYEYVKKNREKIEKALLEMKELSAGETERVYIPVTKAVKRLIEYINTRTNEDYPLGKQEKLISAVQILIQ